MDEKSAARWQPTFCDKLKVEHGSDGGVHLWQRPFCKKGKETNG
jgi:hypothetical protein